MYLILFIVSIVVATKIADGGLKKTDLHLLANIIVKPSEAYPSSLH